MSGVYQHGFGKKRKLESLREHQNLCIHLEVFREFMIDIGGCNFFWFLFLVNYLRDNTHMTSRLGVGEGDKTKIR